MTSRQIPPNIFLHTDRPMKIKVSPAQSIGSFLRRHRLVKEGRADLHNLDISRVK